MTTKRKVREYWTEVKRVIIGSDGEPLVKQTVCCCKDAGSSRKQCAEVSKNKTPCRCDCHSNK